MLPMLQMTGLERLFKRADHVLHKPCVYVENSCLVGPLRGLSSAWDADRCWSLELYRRHVRRDGLARPSVDVADERAESLEGGVGQIARLRQNER